MMSEELVRIANASVAQRWIADSFEKELHVDIDHAHIDDIGEIHGDMLDYYKEIYQ